MDVREINNLLSRGEIDRPGLMPHLAELEAKTLRFRFEFGLDELPVQPGLITIRGPRQYGKSTWLERECVNTIRKFGKGSACYLNGDEIVSPEHFGESLLEVGQLYPAGTQVRRLFIDEVTAVYGWEKVIKKILDRGHLRDVLIVTTGSRAADLRHGSERLPGRKGKLAKSEYLFLPVSYRQFHAQTSDKPGPKTWIAYLLTGGSPVALNEMHQSGRLPEYFIQSIRDWIFGEIVSSGRSRIALSNLLAILFKQGGKPVGFAKLARESGMANNTVAAGYIEQLGDLMCVLPAWPVDGNNFLPQLRKPSKFNFINLAAVVALHPAGIRAVSDWEALSEEEQAVFLEWGIAQEIWRRSVLAGVENPEAIHFWQSKEHEIDFFTPAGEFVEVKRGASGPMDFAWFPKIFPKKKLNVVCATPFKSSAVEGIALEDFFLKDR
ncbi:MAG: ATP-binding protein [Deltaproteobacteria bacterium]|nr:ATP-binding protein [Deltaproteobacteria bacterium]